MKRHAFDVDVVPLRPGRSGHSRRRTWRRPSLDWDVAGPWFFPVALIVLGVAAIVGAVSGLRPRRDAAADDDPVEPPSSTTVGSGQRRRLSDDASARRRTADRGTPSAQPQRPHLGQREPGG